MTLLKLRNLVKTLIGSPLPSVVRHATPATENANILAYINAAMDEVTSHIGGPEQSQTIPLVDGTRLYNGPAGLRDIKQARFVEHTDNELVLSQTRPEYLPADYRDKEGEPEYYYFEGNQIGFYPIPGPDEDGELVRVLGWVETTDLAIDTDIPGLPLVYHRLISVLAVVLILEAQARAEAQSANSDIAADSVAQESRTKEYSFRAEDFRKLYESELFRVQGPRI